MTKDKVGNTLHKSLVLGWKPSGHRPTPGPHAVCAAGGPGLEVPSSDLKPSKSSKSKATSQDRSQQRPPLNPHEAPALAGGPTRAELSSLEPGFPGATKGTALPLDSRFVEIFELRAARPMLIKVKTSTRGILALTESQHRWY